MGEKLSRSTTAAFELRRRKTPSGNRPSKIKFSEFARNPDWLDALNEPDTPDQFSEIKKSEESNEAQAFQKLAQEIYLKVEQTLFNSSISIETRTELMRLVGDMVKSPVYAETVMREIAGDSKIGQKALVEKIEGMEDDELITRIRHYCEEIQNFSLPYAGHVDDWMKHSPERRKSQKANNDKSSTNKTRGSIISRITAYFSKK